jgi:hypothetical protein
MPKTEPALPCLSIDLSARSSRLSFMLMMQSRPRRTDSLMGSSVNIILIRVRQFLILTLLHILLP